MMSFYLSTERVRDIMGKKEHGLTFKELNSFTKKRQTLKYLANIYCKPSEKLLTESDYKNIHSIYFVLTDDGTSLGQGKVAKAKQFIGEIKSKPTNVCEMMTIFI